MIISTMFYSKEKVFLLILWVIHTTVQASLDPQLILYNNDCGCLIYECTVSGEGAIIWSGSAFECRSTAHEIILFGVDLDQDVIECNNGAVKAHKTTYNTSQLIITDSSMLNGTDIECRDHTEMIIGNVSISTVPSEPPSSLVDLQLAHVGTGVLIFKWKDATAHCLFLRYEINATGCGNCPNNTVNKSATCVGVPINSTGENLCMFAVKTVICESNKSSSINSVNVPLKVPLVIVTEVLPTYYFEGSRSRELIQLKTTFRDSTEPFNFSDTIDGSALSYTITYKCSNSSTICATTKVQATSCLNQTCKHTSTISNFSDCLTSSGIMVTVFGTNKLGNGSDSIPVLIETTNRFVSVTASRNSSTIVCKFLNWQPQNGSNSTCTLHAYSPQNGCHSDENKHSTHNIPHMTSDSHTVILDIADIDFQPSNAYCFVVTASNGSFTAEVIVNFDAIDTLNTKTERVTITAVILTLFGIVTILGIIAATTAVCVKKRKLRLSVNEIQTPNNQDSSSEEDHYTLPPGLHSTSSQEKLKGECNSLQPLTAEEQSEPRNGNMIYADIGPNTATKGIIMLPLHDDRVEYAQVQHTQTEAPHIESKTTETMRHMNLDNLLIHLRDEVTPKWYELGEIIGVPKETLDKYSDHPPDQCIIEVLDYWLMLYRDKLTWKDVAHALKEINFHQLSEKVLQIYENRCMNEAKDSLSHNEADNHSQQNFRQASPVPLSNIENAESRDDKFPAADQTDIMAEGTPPPPLPPKCKERKPDISALPETTRKGDRVETEGPLLDMSS